MDALPRSLGAPNPKEETMSDLSFDELFDRLRTHDESLDIEAKRGSQVGKSIMETVCAFANEPGRNGG